MAGSTIVGLPLHVVRLTGPIFPPGPHECSEVARHGWSFATVGGASPEEIIPHLGDADIVSVVGTKMPKGVIDALSANGRCRAIARLGAGTDRIDVGRATACGIVVMNTPYFCVEEQADHAMAMILSLARKLPGMQRLVEAGDYAGARRASGSNPRMSDTTLGLVGFGRSAIHLARRARGFGMRVIATRRNMAAPTTEADAIGVEMVSLDTVLRESNFLSLHMPLVPGAYHLIDADALARMRPGSFLVNTSRGALVDEVALGEAIRSGHLAGAGLDTFELFDPLEDAGPPHVHPLMGLDNVVLSPHVAAGSNRSGIDAVDAAIANIAAIAAGRWPLPEHRVNPEVVPRFPLDEPGD
jgi:phosphoglycerate dehydrogenase-like enzyme